MPSNVKENPMLLTVSQAAELLQLGRDTRNLLNFERVGLMDIFGCH